MVRKRKRNGYVDNEINYTQALLRYLKLNHQYSSFKRGLYYSRKGQQLVSFINQTRKMQGSNADVVKNALDYHSLMYFFDKNCQGPYSYVLGLTWRHFLTSKFHLKRPSNAKLSPLYYFFYDLTAIELKIKEKKIRKIKMVISAAFAATSFAALMTYTIFAFVH